MYRVERFEITLLYSAGNKHLCTCWKMHIYLCNPCICLHNTVLSHSPREHYETFISHPSFCFCSYSSYFILTSNMLCYSPFYFPRESLIFFPPKNIPCIMRNHLLTQFISLLYCLIYTSHRCSTFWEYN